MLYRIIAFLGRVYLYIVHRMKVYGRENVPKKGPVFFISNHMSNWDPFLFTAANSTPIVFLGKRSLFEVPVFGTLIKLLRARPLDRDGDPRTAINTMVEVLEEGKRTAMFPEGTRNKVDNQLQPFKKGAAVIACKAGVPVIPVAIYGTNKKKAFHKVAVSFGKPFLPEEGGGKKALEATTQRMEDEVRALLTPMLKKYGE